jgi:Tfp pilus assembly protein PilV
VSRQAEDIHVAVSRANDPARDAPEAGFALVETLMSAVLVVLAATGLYAALDGASRASGMSRSRGFASMIAQQDQERMRSFRAADLSNLRQTRTQAMGNVTYTVSSRGDWITDSSGTASCTGGQAKASYVKLTSTITWPNMTVKPIVVESLMAPPNGSFAANQGSLAVQVRDRGGAGVPDVGITATGPESKSDPTNEVGCVLWGYLTEGDYTLSFSRPGWVDRQGVTAISKLAGVIGESTATAAFDYDRAGSIAVSFDTKPAGRPVQAAQAEAVTVANSGLDTPGSRLFKPGGWQTAITASSLFPFTDPYAVYAGDCSGADPRGYGAAAGTLTVGPGASLALTVRQPALNLAVTRGGAPLGGANVRLTARAAGCGGIRTMLTNSSGELTLPGAAASSLNPGLPYGDYDVCVDDGVRRAMATGVQNRNPNGTAPVALAVPVSGPTGPCP